MIASFKNKISSSNLFFCCFNSLTCRKVFTSLVSSLSASCNFIHL
ncbi:transposase [Listeria monocytogenes]|nr:transposase [Listeria monocytogenes]